ncbi:MAG: ferrochelatase [Pseudomonadota bacterium]|nr:ferrochelatase [Pseudomonadota bacterium]
MTRTAVVLFNLGGPDRPESVRPFLFNLFHDPFILRVPGLLRLFLAWLISRRRTPEALKIYARLGGKSPLLENTQAQARVLEQVLNDREKTARVFIAMRYWHPLTDETVRAVQDFGPDRIVLLPLYPQWSTTTTASSFRIWKEAARKAGLSARTTLVCCWPMDQGFVSANADLVRTALEKTGKRSRVLFSAHGLPEKVVRDGDPYQWQCEQTTRTIVDRLGIPDLDYVSCYQSRVGPLKWIGPSTEDEIRRAGRDRVPVVVCPLSFVSEHSETLVEIGEDFRRLAADCGVPAFEAVPAAGTHPDFIRGLADLVEKAAGSGQDILSPRGDERLCPAEYCGCVWGRR